MVRVLRSRRRGRGEIPSDLLSDAEVVERLPVMFQAMRDMDPAKLDRFIDLVRRS